jgi:hypothetical protein
LIEKNLEIYNIFAEQGRYELDGEVRYNYFHPLALEKVLVMKKEVFSS